ncbi:hypothetical protein WJX77_011576 [Trebouxia sp. C0004]
MFSQFRKVPEAKFLDPLPDGAPPASGPSWICGKFYAWTMSACDMTILLSKRLELTYQVVYGISRLRNKQL